MKISSVFFRLLISKGIDPQNFVEVCSFAKINGMVSNTYIYNNVGELEATITLANGCIYVEIDRPDFSYYDDIFGDTILWLRNVSIPEVVCSVIVGAGKMAHDLIEFGEENAFLKGCGTILAVENDEIGVTVKTLPTWIEIG